MKHKNMLHITHAQKVKTYELENALEDMVKLLMHMASQLQHMPFTQLVTIKL